MKLHGMSESSLVTIKIWNYKLKLKNNLKNSTIGIVVKSSRADLCGPGDGPCKNTNVVTPPPPHTHTSLNSHNVPSPVSPHIHLSTRWAHSSSASAAHPVHRGPPPSGATEASPVHSSASSKPAAVAAPAAPEAAGTPRAAGSCRPAALHPSAAAHSHPTSASVSDRRERGAPAQPLRLGGLALVTLQPPAEVLVAATPGNRTTAGKPRARSRPGRSPRARTGWDTPSLRLSAACCPPRGRPCPSRGGRRGARTRRARLRGPSYLEQRDTAVSGHMRRVRKQLVAY